MLQESVKRIVANEESLTGELDRPGLEARAAILYNPEVRSPNFFLPGLIVFVLPSITVILVALSIAGERERGTMEQLTMTPITSLGMLLGKVLPYGLLGLFQESMILIAIRYVFQVPIQGSVPLLLLLSIPYIMTTLALGLIVAAHANTNMDAMPFAFLIRIVPPLYLSGYIFPIESMPDTFQSITKMIPERYFMEIVRGIMLRGAGFEHLWQQTLILCLMSVMIFFLASFLYRKKDW
jgi:ABC-2 type transport system permease protein